LDIIVKRFAQATKIVKGKSGNIRGWQNEDRVSVTKLLQKN
jgi:hypothetical protein